METKRNDPKQKQGTIEEIYFLRGFGVLAVIAIHTTGYFTEIPHFNTLVLLNLWTDIFSQFAVPLFILISGFVLAKNYPSKFSLTRFYQKRMRSIIPQYLIFSVAYTAFNNWQVMRHNPLKSNLSLLLQNILQANASYHLWFFAIIIQFYLLYPLILKIYDYFKRHDRTELLIALALVLQSLWMVSLHTPYFPNLKINFVAYLFYFGMGIYTWDHFDDLKTGLSRQTPTLMATSLALTIGSSLFIIIGLTTGYQYGTIPAYFFIGPELVYPSLRMATFLLLFNLSRGLVGNKSFLAKAVYKIGDYSFGIYLIHIFFNQSAIRLLQNYHLDFNNWVFYPFVYGVTVFLSYLGVRLLSFLPYSYYIIGYRKKPRTRKRAEIKAGH